MDGSRWASDTQYVHHSKLCCFGAWGMGAPPSAAGPVRLLAGFPKVELKGMSTGFNSLVVVTSHGLVIAMGVNRHGQLGLGHNRTVLVPTVVPAFNPETLSVSKVSCGMAHTAFLITPGRIFVSGWPSPSGSSADAAGSNHLFADVACGDRHTLAVTKEVPGTLVMEAEVYAWGDGSRGRLGLGSEADALTPQRVSSFYPNPMLSHKRFCVNQVAAGGSHSAAVSNRGELFTWGCGSDGKLGHGSATTQWQPVRVEALASVVVAEVALGDRHSLALDVDGDVYSWGRAAFGRLGHGAPEGDVLTPTPVPGLPKRGVAAISAGASHSAAVGKLGTVYTWGDGGSGKLGFQPHVDVHAPAVVDVALALGPLVRPQSGDAAAAGGGVGPSTVSSGSSAGGGGAAGGSSTGVSTGSGSAAAASSARRKRASTNLSALSAPPAVDRTARAVGVVAGADYTFVDIVVAQPVDTGGGDDVEAVAAVDVRPDGDTADDWQLVVDDDAAAAVATAGTAGTAGTADATTARDAVGDGDGAAGDAVAVAAGATPALGDADGGAGADTTDVPGNLIRLHHAGDADDTIPDKTQLYRRLLVSNTPYVPDARVAVVTTNRRAQRARKQRARQERRARAAERRQARVRLGAGSPTRQAVRRNAFSPGARASVAAAASPQRRATAAASATPSSPPTPPPPSAAPAKRVPVPRLKLQQARNKQADGRRMPASASARERLVTIPRRPHSTRLVFAPKPRRSLMSTVSSSAAGVRRVERYEPARSPVRAVDSGADNTGSDAAAGAGPIARRRASMRLYKVSTQPTAAWGSKAATAMAKATAAAPTPARPRATPSASPPPNGAVRSESASARAASNRRRRLHALEGQARAGAADLVAMPGGKGSAATPPARGVGGVGGGGGGGAATTSGQRRPLSSAELSRFVKQEDTVRAAHPALVSSLPPVFGPDARSSSRALRAASALDRQASRRPPSGGGVSGVSLRARVASAGSGVW